MFHVWHHLNALYLSNSKFGDLISSTGDFIMRNDEKMTQPLPRVHYFGGDTLSELNGIKCHLATHKLQLALYPLQNY